MIGRSIGCGQLSRVGLAIALAACSAPPAGRADEPRPALPPVARSLPAGTVLRLLPARATTTAAQRFDHGFVDALLREALRLSPRFDIAADLEDCEAPQQLAVTLDPAAGQLAVALLTPDEPPLPLCAVAIDAARVPDAVDRLAWSVRTALGEDVPDPPPAVADVYSASAECVRATERALSQDLRGLNDVEPAKRARQADPGCALAWNAQATAELAQGDFAAAARTAAEALRLLGRRLSPTTQHRLARVLLLARARDVPPQDARAVDEDLLRLGETFARERPHDPHGRYTVALASNYLGRFDVAARELSALVTRWPQVPWVGYHLAWARLGDGDPEAALAAIEAVGRRLPDGASLLPLALALYGAGEHGELDDLLARAALHDPAGSAMRHEILRMQAAHAILTERRAVAIDALLADLEWLRERPALSSDRAVDIAEAGEVLARLGAHDALVLRLEALRALPALGATARLAVVFAQGLSAAAVGEFEIADIAVGTLTRAQNDLWATRLRAAIARARGDLSAEATELATAVRMTDDPLPRAAFARTLRELGRRDDAQALLDATRSAMAKIDLRSPLGHPLLAPGRALAFLAIREAR